MRIRHFVVLVATMLLIGAAGSAAAASSASASSDKTAENVLPVYVEVNEQGKITTMDPAYDIQPDYENVLRKTLQGMITKPAHDKNGKPIDSRFIINMNMNTTERKDGTYHLKFSYVSIKKVPPGSWHWSHSDHGRKLALVSSGGRIMKHRVSRSGTRRMADRVSQFRQNTRGGR